MGPLLTEVFTYRMKGSNLKNSTQKMVWGLERLFLRGLKWASSVTVIQVK